MGSGEACGPPTEQLVAYVVEHLCAFVDLGGIRARVVQKGMMTDIATSALPTLMRAGSGALAYGYKVSFPEDDKDEMKYAVARTGGRQVMETSEVGSFKRPEQPLKLYEFEGCPFCKVGARSPSSLSSRA